MKLNHKEVARLEKLGNTLNQALAKLDERGTNRTVSQAMSIVFTGFESVLNGKKISSDRLHRFAMRKTSKQ
jgi:hypothetical protein